MWVCTCVDGFVHVSITYILQLCTWFSEVVSFRVFEVSFGAEFRGGVSEHGPGQFWRIRTGQFQAQACKNQTETAHFAHRN